MLSPNSWNAYPTSATGVQDTTPWRSTVSAEWTAMWLKHAWLSGRYDKG